MKPGVKREKDDEGHEEEEWEEEDEEVEEGYVAYRVYVDGWETQSWADAALWGARLLREAAELTRGHCWSDDGFRLAVAGSAAAGHWLCGRQAVGDDVDDEWVAIGVLRALTARHAALSCCVADSDGEPLLIEAAEHLPAWVEPPAVRHRVWLRGGALHVVGYPATPADVGVLPGSPAASRADCLAALRAAGAARTRLAPAAQAALAARLERTHAACATARTHRARCLLAPPAARIVAHCPALVPRAAAAYRARTRAETAQLARGAFPSLLEICGVSAAATAATAAATAAAAPREQRVCARCVAFTRTAYAQLVLDEPAGELPVLRGHRDRRAWQLGRELEDGLRLLCARGRAAAEEGPHGEAAAEEAARRRGDAAVAELAERARGVGVDAAWLRACCEGGLCGLPDTEARDVAAWRSAVAALASECGCNEEEDDEKGAEDSDAWLAEGAAHEAELARAVEAQQAAFFRALAGDDAAAAHELLGRLDAYAQQSSAYGAPSDDDDDDDDEDDEDDDEDEDEDEWDAEAVAEMERAVGGAVARSACMAPLLAARNSAEACAAMVLHAVRGHSNGGSGDGNGDGNDEDDDCGV